MSTWTSDLRLWIGAASLAALTALAGCDDLTTGQVVPNQMVVVGGSVVVAGPRGFCIDTQGSHDGDKGAFVLLGSCASLAGSASNPRPAIRAVLTASVSAGDSGATVAGSQAMLKSFFASDAGRVALSRSGQAATVKVLSTQSQDGVFLIKARDTSVFEGKSVVPEYWRAIFDLNGHIVTLSVFGLPGAPYSDQAWLATLKAFVRGVRAATPVAAAAANPVAG